MNIGCMDKLINAWVDKSTDIGANEWIRHLSKRVIRSKFMDRYSLGWMDR